MKKNSSRSSNSNKPQQQPQTQQQHNIASSSNINPQQQASNLVHRMTTGSKSIAYYQIKFYFNQYLSPRKEQLHDSLERILNFYNPDVSTSTSTTSTNSNNILSSSSSSFHLLDRKNPSNISRLVSKVSEWTRGGVTTQRELRSKTSTNLLKDVAVVLESLVYLLYDESNTNNPNSSGGGGGSSSGATIPFLGENIRHAVSSSVSTLTAFAARMSLIGYSPKPSAPASTAFASNFPNPLTSSLISQAATTAESETTTTSSCSENAGKNDSNNIKSSNNSTTTTTTSATSTEIDVKGEINIRTAAMFLISCLVHLHPDSVFPLWTTLFPDGDPTEELNARCTLLSPLLYDDYRVRCAAIHATVSLISSVSNTLSVVPLEIRRTFSSISSTSSSSSPSSASKKRIGSLGASAYQSDISRVGAVLYQVFKTLLTALKYQHEVVEKTSSVLKNSKKSQQKKTQQQQQQEKEEKKEEQITSTSTSTDKTSNTLKQRDWGKLFSSSDNKTQTNEHSETAAKVTTTTTSKSNENVNNNETIFETVFQNFVATSLRMLLVNALGTLATVVPFHRATSVAKLLFSFLGDHPRVLISPIEAGAEVARAEGGAVHDQGLTAALFLFTTLNNSFKSRHILRVFHSTPSGIAIIEAGISVLPHIDAWKMCSAIARHHPDTLRKFWSKIFESAVELFQEKENKTLSSSESVVSKPKRIPYQASLECLRTFVYFIGVRALPWDYTSSSSSSSSSSALKHKISNSNASSSASASSSSSSSSSRSSQSSSSAILLNIGAPKTAVRRKTVGDGITPNVVPVDSSDEHELRVHRATNFEISEILHKIALPGAKSPIDNIRCVAYRILAAIPDTFVVTSSSSSEKKKNSSSSNNNNNTQITLPEKEQEELINFMVAKCRVEMDEARLEVLAVAYSWFAFVPALMNKGFSRLTSVICDELLRNVAFLSAEGRTRASQVVEIMASKIAVASFQKQEKEKQEKEEEENKTVEERIADECTRILRAANGILKHHSSRLEKLMPKFSFFPQENCKKTSSSASSLPTTPLLSLSTIDSHRAAVEAAAVKKDIEIVEAPTQLASSLRACVHAVCAMPVDYLVMEFGDDGDDAVTWLFTTLLKHSAPLLELCVISSSSLLETATTATTIATSNQYKSKNNNNVPFTVTRVSRKKEKENTKNENSNEIPIYSLTNSNAIILVAVIESIGKLLSSCEAAIEYDPEDTLKCLQLLARAIVAFVSTPELSRELYAVSGAALRAITKIALSQRHHHHQENEEESSPLLLSFFFSEFNEDELVVKLIQGNNNSRRNRSNNNDGILVAGSSSGGEDDDDRWLTKQLSPTATTVEVTNNEETSNNNNNTNNTHEQQELSALATFIIENTLSALQRSVKDADVARSGLQEDFNDACSYTLKEIVPLVLLLFSRNKQQKSQSKNLCEEYLQMLSKKYDDILRVVPVAASALRMNK